MSQTSWEDDEVGGAAFNTSASSPLDVVSVRDLLSDVAVNCDRPGHVLICDRPSIDFTVSTLTDNAQPLFAFPVTLDLRADGNPFNIRSRTRSYFSGVGGSIKYPRGLAEFRFFPRGPIGNFSPFQGFYVHELEYDDDHDSSNKKTDRQAAGFGASPINVTPWLRQSTVDYNGVSTTVQLFQGQIVMFFTFTGWAGSGTEPDTVTLIFDQLHMSTWYGEV